jgi:putative SOS response-associated peptidase YedK
MCNLYSLTTTHQAILRLFRVSHNRSAAYEPKAAIFPAYPAPVVRVADDGERELVAISWGFILLQDGRAPRRVTNVRDDKILTSKFWKPSFVARRCLVPASSYCAPDGNKPAGWHWFALRGKEDRPPFAFPGIWRRWTGPIKKDGPNVDVEVYAFMTTELNELTKSINHERMPVLLSGDEAFDTWLTGSDHDAFALATSFGASGTRPCSQAQTRWTY